ncbi:insulinase family protein [Hahella sp. CR1]|uniref:insulinase family protein n=1 Tax=Hahella sp. CR1 TaxID=2992807 RepID=UPI002443333F|nr:insulinase family protein [Hahella sp. CR1]MDG9667478.1 insulinase family protein [Hahella sp. CR1]
MSDSLSLDIAHPTFECISRRKIDALKIELQEFRHLKTGARHFHLSSEQKENVFLVALRTVPTDSTGVAHILEHTTLCGSKNFPVRDPFFMMTRRSLNTFMNAFTSSDWTAYPFASQNRKDYFNLLDVYLDSVFFANLNELDFAQEGHRFEFEEAENSNSDLVYKGVVYNEMKGAMSSPMSQLWGAVTKYLYPTSTYHFNSGGEPDHIPDLTHEQLLQFYRKHYHPSNAVFMTFGDLPASELQKVFEDKALQQFERSDDIPVISDEKRYFSPIRVQEAYPLAAEEESASKSHIVMGWLLTPSGDLERNLEAHLLSNVLLENSASPLMHALETTDLGHSPSGLCGLEDSYKEMAFVCGIEGSEPERAAAFESLVVGVLEKVATEGVPLEKLEAVLHQLELSQREISGDSYPYGLQLILAAMSPALQGVDPAELLDIDPVLVKLRERIKNPEYIKTLVKELLLDNPHRITLTLAPDAQLEAQREKYTHAKLQAVKSRLSDEEKQKIVAQAQALNERQNQKDPEDILPKVGLDDVPLDIAIPEPAKAQGALPLTAYAQGTNGIIYHQAILPLPDLSDEELSLLPLLTFCLAEVGAGERSYLEMQERQSAYTGGVSCYWEIRGEVADEQKCKGFLVVSGKALQRNQAELIGLMKEFLYQPRFDELDRIKELVALLASRREQGVTSNGHGMAMMAAASRLSPAGAIGHRTGGLAGIQWIKTLDKSFADKAKLQAFADSLKQLHQKLVANPAQFLSVAEPANLDAFNQAAFEGWGEAASDSEVSLLNLPATREHCQVGWITNSQVSFCAKVYATVPSDHADAAALTVLGHYLRNGFLHRAIREQGGAYGAGAGQDNANSVFRFYSYRDPRIEGTLSDFDESVTWLLNREHDPAELEQAVLGVVSNIDKPRSPAGEAKSAFHSELFGRTAEQRKQFRRRVLAVTMEDLERVANTYLLNKEASVAVVSGENAKDTFTKLNLAIHKI